MSETEGTPTNGEEQAVDSDKFAPAPEVEFEARVLIEVYHERLAQARIKYLFRTESWTSKGRTVYGKASKASERDRAIHGYDFIIVINRGVWRDMTPDQRKALVDHELSHCILTENGSWGIADHDVQEFKQVIDRHGLWAPDLKGFAEAVRQHQIQMFAEEDVARGEAAAASEVVN